MKKYFKLALPLIIALAMILPAVSTQAQVMSLISTGNGLARDTVTNAGVKNLVKVLPSNKATIAIQVDITKISGTLAGTVIPVASNDGVTFYAAGSSSFTVTDVASQGVLFNPPLGFAYYGVRWTGTGSMAGSFVAKILARNAQ